MKFLRYLKSLTQANSNESSKRFLAMYVMVGLVSFSVIMYTDKGNVELILGELLTTGLMLVGIGSWEKRNKEKYGKDRIEGDEPD